MNSKIKLTGWASEIYRTAKRNARKREIIFDLSELDMLNLIDRAKNKCEVTGITLITSAAHQEGVTLRIAGRRPWAPSLDRINSSTGYIYKNCRIVCCAANLAMNEWGIVVLKIISLAMAQKYPDDFNAIKPIIVQTIPAAIEPVVIDKILTPSRMIRENELRNKIGLSHTTIWRLVNDGNFPKPMRIGKRAVAWNEAHVDQWIESRPLQ